MDTGHAHEGAIETHEPDPLEPVCGVCKLTAGGTDRHVGLGEDHHEFQRESPVEAPEPIILKTRTLLRDQFLRLWRIGQQMQPEGIAIAMLCPTCHSIIQLGLQGAQVTELKCNCTLWSIRAIHI